MQRLERKDISFEKDIYDSSDIKMIVASPLFFTGRSDMKELSVFIDESGDFGEYNDQSPYYIITIVFHDQSILIEEEIHKLDQELSYMNLGDLCIHTGPLYVGKRFMNTRR